MSGNTGWTDLLIAFLYVAAALRFGLFEFDKRPTPIDPEVERQRHERI